jgi:hypothetical protein
MSEIRISIIYAFGFFTGFSVGALTFSGLTGFDFVAIDFIPI